MSIYRKDSNSRKNGKSSNFETTFQPLNDKATKEVMNKIYKKLLILFPFWFQSIWIRANFTILKSE